MKNAADNVSTKSNFGAKGWQMIIVSGLMFFFQAATMNDGLNIIVSNFANLHTLDPNTILSLATPAALFGIIGAIVWAIIIDKIGSRLGGLISLVLGGISFGLYGAVSSNFGFFIVTALVNFMAYGFCLTAANNLMANWFPRKKGLALGWATMGQNLSSALFIPLLLLLTANFGVNGSFVGVGILMIVVAIIWYLVVRNTPEEYGCKPDNGVFPEDELAAEEKERAKYKSPWTTKKLIANKQVWLIGVGYGIYIMVTAALVSQMIPRLMAGGWSQAKSTSMMSVAAVLGLLGSYLTGWLDQKIGTKKASIIYGLWYLVALIFCALPPNDVVLYLSVFFTGIGIGGIGNLLPSMVAVIFHRFDFAKGMGPVNVINLIMRSFTFVILSFGLTKLGGYAGAYAIFAVLDIIGIFIVSRIKDERISA